MLLFFKLLKGELFCCKVAKINLIPGGDSSLAALAKAALPLQQPAHGDNPISRAQAPFIL